jgi:hypothetical protein
MALRSYLNAILAAAKCMGKVCLQEGLIFSDRLRRLPHPGASKKAGKL